MGAPTARYFRLYCYDAQASYYRIGRLKALATEGGADLCVGGTAFGNSDYYPASRAFGDDDISDSQSWAGNPGNGRTIGYDFGAPTTFAYIVITNGAGGGASQNAFSFDIQVSNDGTNWTTLMSVPFSARLSTGGLSYTYALATYAVSGVVMEGGAPVSGRKVRAYRRDTGAMLGETTSAATTGAYSLTLSYGGEVQVVCLDDDAGTTFNDLIARTTPA